MNEEVLKKGFTPINDYNASIQSLNVAKHNSIKQIQLFIDLSTTGF
jgi:hypothetical protein